MEPHSAMEIAPTLRRSGRSRPDPGRYSKAVRFSLLVIIGICLALSSSRVFRSQSSTIDTCLTGMAAGSWQTCAGANTTLTGHIPWIFPEPAGGGLSFTIDARWNSSTRQAYFWVGEHPSNLVCFTPPIDPVACADDSQVFIKYNDATNTFTQVIDATTGKPHDGKYAGYHAEGWGDINLLTGDFLRTWSGDPMGAVDRYDHTDLKWHAMHAMPSSANGGFNNVVWFPDAARFILVNGTGSACILATGCAEIDAYDPTNDAAGWPVIVGDLAGTPSSSFQNIKMGFIQTRAIYNPILHEVLLGGGSSTTTGVDFRTHFRILTYSGGTFHLSADRTIAGGTNGPTFNICNDSAVDSNGFPSYVFRFETADSVTMSVVDPVSGHYIVVALGTGCTPQFWDYNSATDTWTNKTGVGGHTPPSTMGGSNAWGHGSSFACEVAPMIDKGALLFLCETSATTDPPAVVILYKADAAGGTTPPSVPTGLTNTAKTAITAELHVNGNETAGSSAQAGWKWKRNGVLVATTSVPWFNSTGLTPGTTYSFTAASYGTDGATSADTAAVNVTTDALLRTFAQKCALAGVIHCDGLDTDFGVNDFYWDSPTYISSGYPATPCDAAMTGLGFTDNPHSLLEDGYTGATFKATAIAQGNTCSHPLIDTTVKHSGRASLKFPIINHSNQAFSGEYYGAFHKYADGHYGYIGPANSGAGTPSVTAVQEGTELWMQYYIRADHTLMQTAFPSTYTGNNAGLGNYTFTISSGAPTHLIATGSGCPGAGGIPSGLAGKQMLFGSGTNFTLGTSFTINSVDGDGCGFILSSSPTGGLNGGSPDPGVPWVSGGSDASGWKNVGIFGNPRPSVGSCCQGAFQGSISNSQWGLPATYSYNQGGGVMDYQTGSAPLNYAENMRGWADAASVQHGAVFNTGHGLAGDPNAIFYPEPPALRYPIDDWVEITLHVVPSATDLAYTLSHSNTCPDASNRANYHTHFEMFLNGQKVWDLPNYVHCWGATSIGGGSSNGLGLFNFSPYMTQTDPNFSHPDTAFWVDDIIVSTQPIPMLSNPDNCAGPFTLASQEPTTCTPYPGGLFVTQLPNAGLGGPTNHLLGNTGSSAASDAMVALLAPEVGQGQMFKLTIGTATTANPSGSNTGMNSANNANPLYYGQASDSLWGFINCTTNCVGDFNNSFHVHIPEGAHCSYLTGTGAGDGFLDVWDQSTNELVRFYCFNSGPGSVYYNNRYFKSTNCCTKDMTAGGGVLQATARIRTTLPDWNVPNPAFSIRSAPLAAELRISEMVAAQTDQFAIKHALLVNSRCQKDGVSPLFVFPAVTGGVLGCGANGISNTNRPLLGQLFFLDHTAAQIAAMSINALQKAILTAGAYYGFYFTDTCGPSTVCMNIDEREGDEAYNVAGITNPFFALPGLSCVAGGGVIDAPTNTCTVAPFVGLPAGWDTHIHVADPCVPLAMAGQPGGCPDTGNAGIPIRLVGNGGGLVGKGGLVSGGGGLK